MYPLILADANEIFPGARLASTSRTRRTGARPADHGDAAGAERGAGGAVAEEGRKPGAGCGRKRPWWEEDTPIEWIDYHTPIYSVSNSTKGKIKMKGQTLVKVIMKEIVVSQCNPF